MSLTRDLREWRAERNTTPNYKVFVSNILEELLEPIYHKDEIPTMVSEIMKAYFDDVDYDDLDEIEILDAIQDTQVFSVNETELMGFDNECCNQEVVRHISSRRQDPTQKEAWEKSGAFGKWQKDRNQNPNEIYQPKYKECRLI